MKSKLMSTTVCVLMIATIFMAVIPGTASADATEDWVARYDGPINDAERVVAMAVDSSGNVYVTGESTGRDSGTTLDGLDYSTIAYDSSGNELWATRYNGPEDGMDRATAIAVDDASGNVYVTGWILGVPNAGYSYATVAYDSLGNELWVATHVGRAYAIAIGPSENIYVTGDATVAYDPLGNELWVATYAGQAVDIAVDSFENIYVTGLSWGGLDTEGGTRFDYATVAYDSLGTELWSARYNGPSNYEDLPRAISVDDSSGNVYVTGSSPGVGTLTDYATVAYDSSGNELWVARYDASGSYDVAFDIDIDSLGNVYVTGESGVSETQLDSVTIAYDSSGNELWVKRHGSPGNYFGTGSLVVDSFSKNIYIAGWGWGGYPAEGGTGYDYVTIAYDFSGTELWVGTYNGPGNDVDSARDIVLDPWGGVYVTGISTGDGTGWDYATLKYSPPVADAGGPYTGDEGVLITFDGTSSYDPDGGPIVLYEWDFDITRDSDGDGDPANDVDATGESPDYAYDDNDIYTVTLWITDADGLRDTDTTTVTVANLDPIVEIGRKYEFDILDDEWGGCPRWNWYESGVTCPTGCWHHPLHGGGEGALEEIVIINSLTSRPFDYTYGETQIFTLSFTFKLSFAGTTDMTQIVAYTDMGGPNHAVYELDWLTVSDNTDEWETRTYDLESTMNGYNDPVTITFQTQSSSGDDPVNGIYIDNIDIVGLDSFSTGNLETIYFRPEIRDAPGDTHSCAWMFDAIPFPEQVLGCDVDYDFSTQPPVWANLFASDDDGGWGMDQGVGSVYILPVYPDGQTEAINGEIGRLPADAFDKNPEQRRHALQNKLDAVYKQIENGDAESAINKLENDILPKLDGDGKNDWVVDAGKQEILVTAIGDLLYSLSLQV